MLLHTILATQTVRANGEKVELAAYNAQVLDTSSAGQYVVELENQLFEEGEANFQEAVMEWDDLSSAEFLAEKTGALDDDYDFATGLLETPEELNFNSEEDQEYLDAVYNAISKCIVTSVKNQKFCGHARDMHD